VAVLASVGVEARGVQFGRHAPHAAE